MNLFRFAKCGHLDKPFPTTGKFQKSLRNRGVRRGERVRRNGGRHPTGLDDERGNTEEGLPRQKYVCIV